MPLKKLSNPEYLQIAELIFNSKTWMHRKVETWTFGEDGTTRRSLSFDLTVKKEFKKLGYVPLTFLDKKVLKSLDVRSASGVSLSTLTTAENTNLAVKLLAAGIDLNPSEVDAAEWQLTEIVLWDSSDSFSGGAQEIYARMTDFYVEALPNRHREGLSYLVRELFTGFILWVRIPADCNTEERTIFKISYHIDLESSSFAPELVNLHWIKKAYARLINLFSAVPFQIGLNTKWGSRYHLEVRAPIGFVVKDLTVFSYTDPEFKKFVASSSESAQVSHLTLDANRNYDSEAQIMVVANRSGFFNTVRAATHSISILLVIPLFLWCLKDSITEIDKSMNFNLTNGNAVTLLLLGPAILITFLATTSEHTIISNRRRIGRVSLYASGAILTIAALTLSGVISSPKWVLNIWAILAVVSTLNSVLTEYWFTNSTATKPK